MAISKFFLVTLTLCLALLTTACGTPNPNLAPANVQVIQEGAALTAEQLQFIENYNCPTGTTKRSFTEAESGIRSSLGGRVTSIVRVQCIPSDMRPEEIPPLARPATPLPSQPHGQQFFRMPYQNQNWGPALPSLGHHRARFWDPGSATRICTDFRGVQYQCVEPSPWR
jgi:hypothetical protein